MNFKDKLRNRYNLLIVVLIIAMSVLVLNLAKLTIVEGEQYRLDADTKRVRNVPLTAARGEIRDRNGKLIAGNKPIFTVQVLKDELYNKPIEERNQYILKLIRLLEEDGADYLKDFPIELNVFKYREKLEDLDETEYVIDRIFEHNLVGWLLESYKKPDGYEEHYTHIPVEKALQIIRNKGSKMPINVDIRDEGLVFSFDETEDIEHWKKDMGYHIDAGPMDIILSIAGEDRTIIREILDHPLSRELVYEKLDSMGLMDNMELIEYNLIYDDEYREQKEKLSEDYPFVTMETSAEEDFINIFKEVSLRTFMDNIHEDQNIFGRKKYKAYGDKLIELVSKEDKNFKMTTKLDLEENTVEYIYEGKNKDLKGDALDILLDEAIRLEVLDDFLLDPEIRGLAQRQLLRDGVNTRISVADGYEYSFVNEKKALYANNKIDMDTDPETAFNILREKAEIDQSISKYEARGMLAINTSLKAQGYMGYRPINVAYGIKPETVAKIEEGMADIAGINVHIEPVRYYPEGETAAHILGYLGRISQQDEIDEYVGEKGYSKNDIIGKTGIEQSFEDNLKGENGTRMVEVDVLGNITKVLGEKKPIPGDNIYLSIDLDVQKKAEESLKKSLEAIQKGGVYESEWGNYQMGANRKKGRPYRHATSGATVAVDVKTGEVIALASYPAYDPNLFSTGISSSDWKSLFPENEKDQLAPRPLYNIATQTAVQTGSTFKVIPAMAGLEKGISPNHKIMDRGYVQIGDKKFGCWIWNNGRGSHGPVDVFKALQDSCNYYFYSLMLGMDQRGRQPIGGKVEIEDLMEMSKKFGLGEKTGIEIKIPAENKGNIPNPDMKSNSMKNMLKNFIRRDLNKYLDKPLKEEELEEKVEVIGSWVDRDEVMSRNQVLEELLILGIDGEKKLPGERDYLVDKIKYTYLNQAKWSMVDSLNASIGQGHGEYTPIQMANAIATLSNGGNKHKLSLIDNIKNYNNSEVKFKREAEFEKIELNNYENLEHVKEGMRRVSVNGTSRRIFQGFPELIATKTGTAQKEGISPSSGEKYDDFAWFVGFGPYDDPEIAVATVIFQGGTGGNAGPMTRDIIGEYLGLNYKEDKNELPFKNTLSK